MVRWKNLYHQLFMRSWWVIAFTLVCAILYEQGLKGREVHYQQLKEQLVALQLEKRRGLKLQQNLQLQINSQSDMDWLELTLKKGLGLVPENEQKVFFFKISGAEDK